MERRPKEIGGCIAVLVDVKQKQSIMQLETWTSNTVGTVSRGYSRARLAFEAGRGGIGANTRSCETPMTVSSLERDCEQSWSGGLWGSHRGSNIRPRGTLGGNSGQRPRDMPLSGRLTPFLQTGSHFCLRLRHAKRAPERVTQREQRGTKTKRSTNTNKVPQRRGAEMIIDVFT